MHRLVVQSQPMIPGTTVLITGDEAEHALRVKRFESGQRIGLLDLQGTVAVGTVESSRRLPGRDRAFEMAVHIESSKVYPPTTPDLELCTATPKAARVDDMLDQLSQLGATSWRPLRTDRGIVDPRPSKLNRLERVAREAAKQSARPRTLSILPELDFAEALTPDADQLILLADPSGQPLETLSPAPTRIRVLIGPEGGWSPAELDAAREHHTPIIRLGPHIQRIETAAATAAAILMRHSTE